MILFDWFTLLWHGWRPRRTRMGSLGLPDRWYWQDPKQPNRWLRSAALIICKRRKKSS